MFMNKAIYSLLSNSLNLLFFTLPENKNSNPRTISLEIIKLRLPIITWYNYFFTNIFSSEIISNLALKDVLHECVVVALVAQCANHFCHSHKRYDISRFLSVSFFFVSRRSYCNCLINQISTTPFY